MIEQDIVPTPGALWVLGCESIRQAELVQFKADVANVCDVVYEPCDGLRTDRQLLDPVVLLFTTKHTKGHLRLVALVQFKTHPSRDNVFYEEGLLKCGTTIYKFRGHRGPLTVATVICSDAFALRDDDVSDLIDRSTLIHIQLNPNPRHRDYLRYRETAFSLDKRVSDCHVLCLNWSRTVVECDDDGKSKTWPAVGCSTWYCAEDACSHADDIVLPNHQLGLYYTHMEDKHRHVLLLDYDEAVFELRVPKVITTRLAINANMNGPNSVGRYEWDNNGGYWAAQGEPRRADFNRLLEDNAEANLALSDMNIANPLNIERLLALSAGTIESKDDWYRLKNIDSFHIGRDEVVRRITVVQDPSESAKAFRHERLNAVANIRHELDSRTIWKPQLEGINRDAQLMWDAGTRNFNIRCSDGRPGLICYLGNEPRRQMLENIASKLIDLLRREGGLHQKRLCVIYRQFGELKFAPLPGITRFDDAMLDERDIASVDPNESME